LLPPPVERCGRVALKSAMNNLSAGPGMDADVVIRVNRLWSGVYPYLAQWIENLVRREPRRVLEIGPFSGGIAKALAARWKSSFFVSQWMDDLTGHMGEFFPAGKSGSFHQVLAGPVGLPFSDCFDLIIVRGAFFFVEPRSLEDIDNALSPGGMALVGGGYGPLTPSSVIGPIAVESKDLNERLGKVRISSGHLEDMLARARLDRRARIIDDGGLWTTWSTPPSRS
jgi:SAM-dependent methyltransferase